MYAERGEAASHACREMVETFASSFASRVFRMLIFGPRSSVRSLREARWQGLPAGVVPSSTPPRRSATTRASLNSRGKFVA